MAERKLQNRFLLTLIALFAISLLPVINLRLSLYQTLGERFLYLPTVFACVLVSYAGMILIRNSRVALMLMILALGFYSLSLYRTNMIWREAAKLSQTIVVVLVSSTSQNRLLILNVPDNLRGVPIFHNGLPEALAYFQNGKQFSQVEIAAYENLSTSTDQVTLSESGEMLTLHAAKDETTFTRASSSACLEVITQSATALQLPRKPCSPAPEMFIFNNGRMQRLQ